jgi:hypothetical protein
LDYDPFAFDVGCLGVLFWNRFGVRFPFMPVWFLHSSLPISAPFTNCAHAGTPYRWDDYQKYIPSIHSRSSPPVL